jgi:hypothetical protein
MKCVLERSQKAIIHFGRYVQIELGFRTPSHPRGSKVKVIQIFSFGTTVCHHRVTLNHREQPK